MEQRQAHPLHVRIGHWINALTLFVMLWTGFAMFASDRHFAAIAALIPAWFWIAMQMPGHRLMARSWHVGFALVLIANALWYGVAAVRTSSWRRFVPSSRTWLADAFRDTIAELRAPRETMQPAAYNGAQKVAYTGVFVMGGLMIVTGLALWFDRQLPWLIAGLGGQRIVLPVHIVLATLFLAFIAVHVVQVLRAGLPTLVAMISGTSDARPANTRRAFAFAGASLVVVFLGFTALRATSGPSGVPSYLQWTVEHGGPHGHAGMHRRGAPRSAG